MKIPSNIQKLLYQQEKLSIELMDVSSKIADWLEENGADFSDRDIKDSVLTGCMIYCEPVNARTNVEEYIKNKM